jgi:2-amino-4-hydroxy-6-hydroxymethyldihydropteridine diphosphokinase
LTKAYLGLGSNLGDRLANLQLAVELLAGQHGLTVLRSSRVYESDPVGGPPQPDFLNAVVEVQTSLTPGELLTACREAEEALARVRDERWGPRTIDIDILTFGDDVVDEPDLTIPHPRMRERGFVLAPLLELEPDPPLPGGRNVATLRLSTPEVTGVRPFAPPLRVPG